MKFDISGSTIVLDKVRAGVDKVQHEKDDWSMILKLKKADIVWKKPLQLKSEIALSMKDSRPIVAMMDNKKVQFSSLSKLLLVEDLRGDAMIYIKDNTITVPYALVKSDKIDIGAKGIISPALRNGMIFFGHKNIRLALEIRDGRKSIDIFSAKKSFDNYVIPAPLP